MKIKSFNQYNEGLGSFTRSLFNKDEKTAEGIFNKISSLFKEDIFNDENHDFIKTYSFNIDDFKIKVTSMPDIINGGITCKVFVDDTKLDASNNITKKIFKLVYNIYNKEQIDNKNKMEEEKDFIRKDARIHFSKR